MIVNLIKQDGCEFGFDAEVDLWFMVLPFLSITLYFDAPNQTVASALFARVLRHFTFNQGVQS